MPQAHWTNRLSKDVVTTMNQIRFNPTELCSRKLWQLVSTETEEQVSEKELKDAIAELAKRRHYLEQLQQIGAIKGQHPGN